MGTSMGSCTNIPDVHPAPSSYHSQRLLRHLPDEAGWPSTAAFGIGHTRARQPGHAFLSGTPAIANILTHECSTAQTPAEKSAWGKACRHLHVQLVEAANALPCTACVAVCCEAPLANTLSM